MPQQHIVVVEDESGIADAVSYALRTEGFSVEVCGTLAAARTALARTAGAGASLAVLDVGLPDGSGFDLLREIRRVGNLPVIMLTSRAEEVDRVVGLELGADDYVAKPFSPRELAARVRAVLRRSTATNSVTVPRPEDATSAVVVDADRRAATFCGQSLELTRYEFRLLEVLAGAPGTVFNRSQLLDLVWDDPGSTIDRTVDTHIKQLRAKLRAIRAEPDPLETLRGEGYRLRQGLA